MHLVEATTFEDGWRATILQGVEALAFSLVPLSAGEVWMTAELARTDLPPTVMTAAAAAMGMDKDVALREDETPIGAARAALKSAIGISPAAEQLASYQVLLAEALWSSVAYDPQLALEAMAEPYE